MANTKISRTPSSASNRKTFTISLWFRIGRHPFTESSGGNSRELIGQTSSGHFRFMIKADRKIRFMEIILIYLVIELSLTIQLFTMLF